MNKKRKFDGVGAQASHGGSWDRSGYINTEAKKGSRFGGGSGGRGGSRDGQNGEGGCGRGGNGPTTNPPTKTDRKIGAAVRTDRKEVIRRTVRMNEMPRFFIIRKYDWFISQRTSQLQIRSKSF